LNPFNLLKSEIIRNSSVLITGTVLAQLISILLQPFLRRFFSPEAFGIYSVYLSLVGIVAVVASLRYDDAVVLPVKDKDSANLITLSLIFNFLINLIIFILILIFGRKLLNFFNLPANFPVSILYLIPAGAFLFNVYQTFNYWLIRGKKYKRVSLNKLIRRGTEGLAQVSFAFLKYPKGLIFSDIIGQIANVVAVIYQAFKYDFHFKMVSLIKLKYVLKKYSEFPRYNLVPAFMSTCSFFLPPIFINKFFSAENAGFFDLSKLILSIPLAFVASSISNVLLQRIAERCNKKQSLLADLRPVFFIVLLICIIEIIIIILFGNGLFQMVFGPDWGISGEISKILVWSFTLNFLVSSFSCLFISMQKIKIYSVWQFLYFTAILLLLLFKDMGFTDFLQIYVIIEVICYCCLLLLMFRLVFKYELSLKNT
jgi:O-antigen/teichoic acid export membrane protein